MNLRLKGGEEAILLSMRTDSTRDDSTEECEE